MRRILHIILLLALVCSCKGPRQIDREDMEDIFYDMLILDQQLKQDPDLRKKADTLLVYEGIFEARGYDTDDFLHSLSYYLAEPARMEKLMGAVVDRLEKESKDVTAAIKHKSWVNRMMALYGMTPDTVKQPRQGPRAVDTLPIRLRADSVYIEKPRDTFPQPHKDSLLFVRDSL